MILFLFPCVKTLMNPVKNFPSVIHLPTLFLCNQNNQNVAEPDHSYSAVERI